MNAVPKEQKKSGVKSDVATQTALYIFFGFQWFTVQNCGETCGELRNNGYQIAGYFFKKIFYSILQYDYYIMKDTLQGYQSRCREIPFAAYGNFSRVLSSEDPGHREWGNVRKNNLQSTVKEPGKPTATRMEEVPTLSFLDRVHWKWEGRKRIGRVICPGSGRP